MEVLNRVLIELEKQEDIRTYNLSTGCAKDYAHYKNLVGEIHGIRLAIESIKEMEAKALHEDM